MMPATTDAHTFDVVNLALAAPFSLHPVKGAALLLSAEGGAPCQCEGCPSIRAYGATEAELRKLTAEALASYEGPITRSAPKRRRAL
jgi:hypothetical protein